MNNEIEKNKIKQTDVSINKIDFWMHQNGCLFRSLQGIAESIAEKNLTAEQINQAREFLQKNDFIRYDLYILNREVIINDALERLNKNNFIVKEVGSGKKYYKNEIQQTDFTTIGGDTNIGIHVRQGDKDGNLLFDPDPRAKTKNDRIFRRYLIEEVKNDI